MSTVITASIRNILSSSLPSVEASKTAIVEALAANLAAEGPDQSSAQARTTAMLLVNMLLEQVVHLVEGRQPQNVEIYREEHRLHAIDERHYTRFAEALIPILRDAAGTSLPASAASSWRNTFGAVVRWMQQQNPCLPFETIVSNPWRGDPKRGYGRQPHPPSP
ncbi:globin family protein [Sphingosinicella rhizophila]|uniref:Globin family profile domain-containing protein n=1 Tax=Sphingosinicella rhizophila TaxID=3050082 RepID=A0ABU3QBT2_9SPHN|nr:hypothetical protein [Sphingosinicella sp. GR2756]MDT9600839.1 hypothetical protein [Sphingosinicella sp. GR2756]